MEIQHAAEGKQGKFYINNEGNEIALMTYHRGADNKIIIDHTEVDESLKGQGVGKKLVEAAVALAREDNVKILPICPFAKVTLERNSSDYSDVLIQ